MSSVLGIVSVGLGYYHLEEFLSHLNVPSMSYVTYHKYEENIQKEYSKLAAELEEEALNEEIRLAKENNEVDSAGNALIAVEFDGSYGKRSYRNNFSSLLGFAAILGLRTKKILYSGVKNKYCHICKIAQSKKLQPGVHVCKRNYEGPSSGMETQIIIDGFKFCAEKGARFHRFIGDGDSRTYKALRDIRLYTEPDLDIEKFECINHLFRNFMKQFLILLGQSKIKLYARKLLSPAIGRSICKGIKKAAQHWRADIDPDEKYANLEKDIMNALLHCIALHDKCAKYFCTKTTSSEAHQTVTILKETDLYYEVLDLCQSYFSNNAESLIAGYTTNKTEGLNSLIAKTVGASPFRLYGEDGIVVVKSPKKLKKMSMREAIKEIKFWKGPINNRQVNQESHWYYEIQGQLHITKRRMAFLVIYLNEHAYEIVELERNDEFWKEHMVKELVFFYNEAQLKELIDPRDGRGMDLRVYDSKKELLSEKYMY